MLRVGTYDCIDIRYLKKGGTIMITQQQEHERQQKAQASSLVKQHRWIVALFSFIGVVLPLVAGFMVWWPWGVGGLNEWILALAFSGVVSVTVGAFLFSFAFRAMLVAVFAGVAWIVGEFLGSLERQLVETGWYALQTWDPFWSVQGSLILVALVPLLFCMTFGAAVASRWME
jgi:hypothetical protein